MNQRSLWSGLVVLAIGACGFPRLQPIAGADDDAGVADVPDGGPTLELALVAGELGGPGNADGLGPAARFNQPTGVAVDRGGNVYLADAVNCTVRKVMASGAVTTIAGAAGQYGSEEGTGGAARFDTLAGVAVDVNGTIYVADTNNSTIRKITAAGVVTTIAGTAGQLGSTDDTGPAARFRFPAGIAVDASGVLYVADTGNHTIRKIVGGIVTTLAGAAQQPGSADGNGAAARFAGPRGVAVDGGGNVFVADTDNHTIRKIAPAGAVTTFAGTAGASGSVNSIGSAARFDHPAGVAVDRNGNLVVADLDNNLIRHITFGAAVTTLAGGGSAGATDATGAAARFRQPAGVAFDSVGTAFVADVGNHTVRKVASDGAVTTLAGAASTPGSANGDGPAARFDLPAGAAFDATGTLYVADANRHTIRKITPDGVVTTLAGIDGLAGSTDGLGMQARFASPFAIAFGPDANLYVTDTDNNTIRRVTLAGDVTTLAGTAGTSGSSNGAGRAARFNVPTGIAADAAGDLYVADAGNHLIRKVTAAGVVTYFAGNPGQPGSANGTGLDARFTNPSAVAVDAANTVYVADQGNRTVRAITPAGDVTTLAGSAGLAGTDDGTGPTARFRSPIGVAVDRAGNVYVADDRGATIRRISPAGETKTYAGIPDTAGIQLGAAPRLAFPRCLAASGDDLIVCDTRAILRLRPR